MQFVVENLIQGRSVQEGTQAGVTSFLILSTLAKPGPNEAETSKEAPMDLDGNSDSSNGPPNFTTPPPALPEKID